MESKKIIVLAGNRREFNNYLDEKGLTNFAGNYIYGAEPHNIMGIEAEKVEVIGTFWDRKDALIMEREAKSRIR